MPDVIHIPQYGLDIDVDFRHADVVLNASITSVPPDITSAQQGFATALADIQANQTIILDAKNDVVTAQAGIDAGVAQAATYFADIDAAKLEIDAAKIAAETAATNAAGSETTAVTAKDEVVAAKDIVVAQAATVSTQTTTVTDTAALVAADLAAIQAIQISVEASETAAATSATQASNSAVSALNSAASAQATKDLADVVKAEAEVIQTNIQAASTAVTADATLAATSAANAATSEANALVSQTAAETAAVNSASSEAAALLHKNDAYQYKLDAELAKAAAEQASNITVAGIFMSGEWSAVSGNAPPVPAEGAVFYKISAPGTINGIEYAINDNIVYDPINTVWFKIDNTEAVASVAGKQGIVTLDTSDIAGLGTAAVADVSAFEPANAVSDHAVAINPHNQYELKTALGTAAYSDSVDFAGSNAITDHIAVPDPHTQYELKTALGSAAYSENSDFASIAQGLLADSAVQPGDIGTAAANNSGDFEAAGSIDAHKLEADPHIQYAKKTEFGDIVYAATTDFATATQGLLADSAIQPGDLGSAAFQEISAFESFGTMSGHVGAANPHSQYELKISLGSAAYDDSTAFEPAGAVSTHVGYADPHTQYELKTALGTAAYSAVLDFATAAQGALADTALQPADVGTAASQDESYFELAGVSAAAIASHVGLPDPHNQYELKSNLGTAAYADSSTFDSTAAVTAHVIEANPHTQYELTANLGTAAYQDTGDFASAAQGTLADTAVQPGDLITFGTSASKDVPDSGDAAVTEVVLGNDSRLADAREWLAATVSSAQALDNASTVRYAWTPQRVHEVINAIVAGGASIDLVTQVDDGLMSALDKTKLNNIEANATADQTGTEIKALYEAEADTNAFTDAEKAKLSGIEANATADQSGAEIKILYEAEANTNPFTDAERLKLTGVQANATANSPDTALRDRSTHTGTQATSTITGLDTQLSTLTTDIANKAPVIHDHDGLYYTQAQVDAAIAGVSSGFNWSIFAAGTASTTLSVNDAVFTDTSTQIQTVNLPASPSLGDTVVISDGAGNWGTNKCVVAPGSNKIMGLAEDMDLDVSNQTVRLTYANAAMGWRIV